MASKLEQARLIRKLSRAEVAEALGIHQNTLMDWEANSGKVRYEHAIALADYYGCTLDELFSDVSTTKCCKED